MQKGLVSLPLLMLASMTYGPMAGGGTLRFIVGWRRVTSEDRMKDPHFLAHWLRRSVSPLAVTPGPDPVRAHFEARGHARNPGRSAR